MGLGIGYDFDINNQETKLGISLPVMGDWTQVIYCRTLFVLVSSIALVKPDRARTVESILLQMAQSGQIAGKVYQVVVI